MEQLRLGDLTNQERAFVCNGCGARSRLVSWVHPPQLEFCGACDEHDLAYWIGGRWLSGLQAKMDADERLRERMFAAIRAAHRHGMVRLAHRAVAEVYFFMVEVFGFVAFHWGRPRGREDLLRLMRRG